MSFVYDNGTLNGSKVDRSPIPIGEDPNKWIQSTADWNPTIAAIFDLRTAIIANPFLGIVRQSSAPSVPVDGAADYVWANNAGILFFHNNGVGDQQLNNPPNNTFVWKDGQSWSTVYAEIQAAGGTGIVLLQGFGSYVVTAGTYDFSNILFYGVQPETDLTFDVGVFIDGGATAALAMVNCDCGASTTLTTDPTKPVLITLYFSIFSNFGGSVPLFITSFNDCEINLFGSSIGLDPGGGPGPGAAVMHLSTSGASVAISCQCGGDDPELPPIYRQIVSYAITGVSGSEVTLIADAISLGSIRDAIDPTPTFNSGIPPGTGNGTLNFPPIPTSALPSPTSNNEGQVAYDTTAGKPKYSDGSTWQLFGGSGAGLFFSSAASVASWSTGSLTGGADSTGALFCVDRSAHVVGARWFQPNTTLPVTMMLWQYDGTSWTQITSQSITPTANTLTTLSFSSAVAITPNLLYVIALYDGTNQLLLQSTSSTAFGVVDPPGAPFQNGGNSVATPWGYGLYLYGFGYTAGNSPNLPALNVPTYFGLDLIYTTP